MKFPWRKILNIGVAIGTVAGGPAALIAGAVLSGVQTVEDNLPELKGGDKAQAADNIVRGIVSAIEQGANKDLLNDAEVMRAVAELRDAAVALRNAEAHLKAAVDAARAAKAA